MPTEGSQTLAIEGMTCGGCAGAVERALRAVPGVTQVQVDLAHGRARVAGGVSSAHLVAAVEAAGFSARTVAAEAAAPDSPKRSRCGCC